MSCPQCRGFDEALGRRLPARDLRRYRRKGLSRATRMLVDAILAEGVEGLTILDVGGGIGAIELELLAAGAASATDIDASRQYLAAAEQEAARRGVAGRVTHRYGDFVELAPEVEPADVVTLDRVVCCYPDVEPLVRLSAERARALYGLVYPLDRWWVRGWGRAINLFLRLRGNPFRFFVHPPREIERILREQGLELRFARTSRRVWQVALYVRR